MPSWCLIPTRSLQLFSITICLHLFAIFIAMRSAGRDIINEPNNEYKDKTYQTHVDKNMLACGNAGLLRAVMENLIANAYKYTCHTENPHIEIGCPEIDAAMTCHVKDNSVGFDMRHRVKLFEPFQRLHHANEFDGSGIDLSAVARIVRLHKGRIWAEGKVDKGAVFYFAFGIIS